MNKIYGKTIAQNQLTSDDYLHTYPIKIYDVYGHKRMQILFGSDEVQEDDSEWFDECHDNTVYPYAIAMPNTTSYLLRCFLRDFRRNDWTKDIHEYLAKDFQRWIYLHNAEEFKHTYENVTYGPDGTENQGNVVFVSVDELDENIPNGVYLLK